MDLLGWLRLTFWLCLLGRLRWLCLLCWLRLLLLHAVLSLKVFIARTGRFLTSSQTAFRHCNALPLEYPYNRAVQACNRAVQACYIAYTVKYTQSQTRSQRVPVCSFYSMIILHYMTLIGYCFLCFTESCLYRG